MSQTMIDEILGAEGEELEQRVADLSPDLSPEYSLSFIFHEMMADQLKTVLNELSWMDKQRDLLTVIENRFSLLLANGNLTDAEKNVIRGAQRDVYLRIIESLEESLCFSTMEATELDMQNWEYEALQQNARALYTLFILQRKETIASFLTAHIQKQWTEYYTQHTSKDQRRVKSLLQYIRSITPPGTVQMRDDVAVIFYHLSEICENILSQQIDAGSFFETLMSADEGELTLQLCSELVPDDNTDFFTALTRCKVQQHRNLVIQLVAAVRSALTENIPNNPNTSTSPTAASS